MGFGSPSEDGLGIGDDCSIEVEFDDRAGSDDGVGTDCGVFFDVH